MLDNNIIGMPMTKQKTNKQTNKQKTSSLLLGFPATQEYKQKYLPCELCL